MSLFLRCHSVASSAARLSSVRCAPPALAATLHNYNNNNNTRSFGSTSSVSAPFRRTHLVSSDLPYHIVVGMPALSPTMEAGGLAEWYVAEGDSFIAGQSLAKIETDKASIDFEAQDDGCVAKILVPDGTDDIAVNDPILITVEEEEDLAAFKDYVYVPTEKTAAATEATPEAAAPAAPAPVAAAVSSPPPPAVVAAPAPPPPAVVATPPPPPPPSPVVATQPHTKQGPSWGVLAKVNSPIAKTLGKQQQLYIEKYGTTGQLSL